MKNESLKKLDVDFFKHPADALAASLCGVIMTRRVNGELRRARIMEVEAYLGPKDLASHSSKGKTKRTAVMFGPPGRAYVYFIYGMHEMFNIVCGTEGHAHAVLVRGAQPLDDWDVDLTGPAKLAKRFNITRADNNLELTGDDISFFAQASYRPRILKTKRIGIDYAAHWKNRLLRFVDINNPAAAKLRFVKKR